MIMMVITVKKCSLICIILCYMSVRINGKCVITKYASEPLERPNIFLSEKDDIGQLKSDVIFPYGEQNAGVFSCGRYTRDYTLSSTPKLDFLTSLDIRYNCRTSLGTCYNIVSWVGSWNTQAVNLKDLWLRFASYSPYVEGDVHAVLPLPFFQDLALEKLHFIDMAGSLIGKILQSVNSSRNMYSLKVLDIRQASFSDWSTLPKILFSFPRLRTLVLKQINEIGSFLLDLHQLSPFNSTLEYLDISENGDFYLKNIAILQTFKHLRVLDLSGSKINWVTSIITERLVSLQIYMYFNVPPEHVLIWGWTQADHVHCIDRFNSDNYTLQEFYTISPYIFNSNDKTGYPVICLQQVKSLHKLYIAPISKKLKMHCNSSSQSYHNLDNLREMDLNNLVTYSGFYNNTVEHYIRCITKHPGKILKFTSSGFKVDFSKETSLCNTLKHVRLLNLSLSDITSIPKVTFTTCHQTTILDLSFNHVRYLHYGIFSDMSLLQQLFLNNNDLSVMGLNFAQSIGLLVAHSNNIQYLTQSSRDSLSKLALIKNISIDLRSNSLSCGCNLTHLETIKWIKTTSIDITSKHSLSCSGVRGKENIYDVDLVYAHQICFPSHLAVIISTSCVNFTFVMVVTSGIMCYKFRYRVKTSILKWQQRMKCWKFKHKNLYIRYDGFISYCAEDRFWVHKDVLDVLETKHGFHLCVHYRDFPAGGDLCEVIIKNMLHSEVIIIVLSHNFIQKPWCEYELQQAQVFAVNYQKHLIIIRKGNIPSHRRTGIVGSILDSRIYISWPEKTDKISPQSYEQKKELFWQKVVNEMHHNKGGCMVSCCKRYRGNEVLKLSDIEMEAMENTDRSDNGVFTYDGAFLV